MEQANERSVLGLWGMLGPTFQTDAVITNMQLPVPRVSRTTYALQC